MSVLPEGEDVRKAVKWISDKKQYEPEDCGPIMSMIEKAAKRFDLFKFQRFGHHLNAFLVFTQHGQRVCIFMIALGI